MMPTWLIFKIIQLFSVSPSAPRVFLLIITPLYRYASNSKRFLIILTFPLFFSARLYVMPSAQNKTTITLRPKVTASVIRIKLCETMIPNQINTTYYDKATNVTGSASHTFLWSHSSSAHKLPAVCKGICDFTPCFTVIRFQSIFCETKPPVRYYDT